MHYEVWLLTQDRVVAEITPQLNTNIMLLPGGGGILTFDLYLTCKSSPKLLSRSIPVPNSVVANQVVQP